MPEPSDEDDYIDRLLNPGRGALDGAVRVSAHNRSEESRALSEQADNLVTKIIRDLAGGNRERAEKYVLRAAGLPFDERERWHPGAWQAHMALFTRLTDEVEESPEGDQAWLDAALQVLPGEPGRVRDELAGMLQEVVRTYRLSRVEERRIRAAVPDGVFDLDPLPRDTAVEEVAASTLALCEVVVAYDRALALALGDAPD